MTATWVFRVSVLSILLSMVSIGWTVRRHQQWRAEDERKRSEEMRCYVRPAADHGQFGGMVCMKQNRPPPGTGWYSIPVKMSRD